jgi:integrase
MASIRKLPSGSYQVQVRRAGMPAVTRSFSKKRDAEAFARAVEGDSELARKLGRAPAHIPTFRHWCGTYMAQYQGRDRSTAGRLAWWCEQFGDQPVTRIDEFMVDEGLTVLEKGGRSGSTINRYKSTLSAVFIHFIRHPDYKRAGFTNPVRKESVSRFRENPAKDRFLSQAEQNALLHACRTSHWDRCYLLVLLALTTGARKGELLGLSWSDIDFAHRTARLGLTKNGKPRLLPLTQPVVEELMRFREHTEFLIFHSTTSRTTPFDISKSWRKALAESGIGHCRFHDLRHTAASNLVRAGRSLFEVGTLLGHSSPQMTQRYSHLAISDTRSMVDQVMGELR